MTKNEEELYTCLLELIRWVYPTEGDWDRHRCEQFTEEALKGYQILERISGNYLAKPEWFQTQMDALEREKSR